jgi:hypothetical protein
VETSQTQLGSIASLHVGSGCQRNGAERYSVLGLIPCLIASVRVNVLKAEPAWRRPCAAMLNWRFFLPGITAVIARMAPFFGLIETRAEAGSDGRLSVFFIALTASRCNRGTMVV